MLLYALIYIEKKLVATDLIVLCLYKSQYLFNLHM